MTELLESSLITYIIILLDVNTSTYSSKFYLEILLKNVFSINRQHATDNYKIIKFIQYVTESLL